LDGVAFYTMEFVEGTDLARRLQSGGPLPVAEKGIVHRDIKPSNLPPRKSEFQTLCRENSLRTLSERESRIC
jgi:serine/threonine protein kinase